MTERGENCDGLLGASGEVGCWQILPSTWEMWASNVLGYVPEMLKENQRYVVTKMVISWMEDGLTEQQIAWKYNSGRTDTCISGVNRHGVRYDSCLYAHKVLAKNSR